MIEQIRVNVAAYRTRQAARPAAANPAATGPAAGRTPSG